jgi:hypothetical protein
MKDKIIEAAGKTWKALGENGETAIPELTKIIKEKDEIALQAIGWLAREDKINYSTKNNKTFISLVESELQAFKRFIQPATTQTASTAASRSTGKAKATATRWIL